MKTNTAKNNLYPYIQEDTFIKTDTPTLSPSDFIGVCKEASFSTRFFWGMIDLISSVKLPHFKLKKRKQIYPFFRR